MNKKYKYTQAEIAAANKVDIVSYCQDRGINLQQISNDEFRGVEHDSLVITRSKNAFFWNSRQIHGRGALNFAKDYELENESTPKEKRFMLAMERVTNSNASEFVKAKSVERTPFKLDKAQFDTKFSKAWSYLVKTRGLNSKLVNFYHDQSLIKQDKYGNAIFLWKEPQTNKIVGASKQGTWIDHDKYGKRGTLKQIEKNSTYGFGASFPSADLIKEKQLPEKMIFFESPIDALSYSNCHPKNTRTLFISMEGLKEEVFKNYLKIAGQNNWPVREVSLGVDNDEAGCNFVTKMQKNMPGVQNEQPDKKFGKDWNDILRTYRQQEKIKSLNQNPKKNLAKRQALLKRASRMR
ncbi:DUF3991 and TOPRIM domain-containing protein [Lactobacillus sp. ESL0681]|uniref:DUF3991 and TOPRIM domain-containing protein n=1 Tax=Lactobacillus sp. ESL0681 TaxID=2983211 RepID=UPI0023F7E3FC|nr:DUF3991 and TOPRIM domain-containing protein [Lactobacillus sp. ESL0681]WEV41284.1 DUF3991 and TOPRIM domain-containing protein [Lactobacillus sp. ESL0681]